MQRLTVVVVGFASLVYKYRPAKIAGVEALPGTSVDPKTPNKGYVAIDTQEDASQDPE